MARYGSGYGRGRSRSYDYFGFAPQPTVAEMEADAAKELAKARKKGLDYHPVVPKTGGTKICTTWWGKSWCDNLERYADYANRLPRGKKYIRHHCVLDLKIKKGEADAVVNGSSVYKIRILFDPLPEKKQKELSDQCSRQIENIDELIQGRFPESLKALFYERGGLFPSPREIHFSCSCPDVASMCKHVAAVMYGIGVRLDEDPLQFFTLRGIDVEPFVTHVIEDRVDTMLENARKKSRRILEMEDIEGLIGIL